MDPAAPPKARRATLDASELASIADQVRAAHRATHPERAALVALSGIDASGKGWLTARLARALRDSGLRVAAIGIDGWLNLPQVRFRPDDPAEHFYLRAFRFDEMFTRLVRPLCQRRSLRLEADLTEETATRHHRHFYDFTDIDVVLLEGRTEHQMSDGEAKRNDQDFCHVAAWEYTGAGTKPNRLVEPLTYENIELAVRSYK